MTHDRDHKRNGREAWLGWQRRVKAAGAYGTTRAFAPPADLVDADHRPEGVVAVFAHHLRGSDGDAVKVVVAELAGGVACARGAESRTEQRW